MTEADFSNWCGWHNDHGALTGLAQGMFFDDSGSVVRCWSSELAALCIACQAYQSARQLSNVPDETAGLYVRTRQGQIVKPSPPPNCMLFQIGEASQVLSGGWLQVCACSALLSMCGCAAPTVNVVGFRWTGHPTRCESRQRAWCWTRHVRSLCVDGAPPPLWPLLTALVACPLLLLLLSYAVFMQPEWWQELAVPPAADMKQLVRGAQGELLPPGVPALADRWKAGQTFGDFATATFAAYH